MVSTYDSRQQVECPRCHEQCGWCSDYRWMHGTMRLPNMAGRKNSRCTIPNMEPEGKGCPLCAGTMKVWRTVAYERVLRDDFTPCGDCHDGFCTMNCSSAPISRKVAYP